MTILRLALLVVAIVALVAALRVYQRARLPAWRRRASAVATIVLSLLAALLLGGSSGWLVAISVGSFAGAVVLLVSAWAWKWDDFVAARTDRALADRPALADQVAANPILRRLMRKPPD